MTTPRLDKATAYLIDLLRAYGHRAVIVKISNNGDTIEVMARTFVKKQLMKAGILFPHNEGLKPISRQFNHSLDTDKLSVIFHLALFEFEEAYVEANCLGNPEAKHYIDTIFEWIERKTDWLYSIFPEFDNEELVAFPEIDEEEVQKKVLEATKAVNDARELLQEYGVETIETAQDLDRLFWSMAYRRKAITKSIREAILELSINQQFIGQILPPKAKAYNTTLNTLIETDKTDLPKDATIKSLREEITELQKDRKEHKKRQQEERKKWGRYNKVAQYLFRQLNNTDSPLFNYYDLGSEDGQEEFLEWYRMGKRKVPNKVVKSMESGWQYSDDALLKIKTKIEEHNSTLPDFEEPGES